MVRLNTCAKFQLRIATLAGPTIICVQRTFDFLACFVRPNEIVWELLIPGFPFPTQLPSSKNFYMNCLLPKKHTAHSCLRLAGYLGLPCQNHVFSSMAKNGQRLKLP